MNEFLKILIETAKEYTKTTPAVWDDLVVNLLERVLRNRGFIEALNAKLTAQGMATCPMPD